MTGQMMEKKNTKFVLRCQLIPRASTEPLQLEAKSQRTMSTGERLIFNSSLLFIVYHAVPNSGWEDTPWPSYSKIRFSSIPSRRFSRCERVRQLIKNPEGPSFPFSPFHVHAKLTGQSVPTRQSMPMTLKNTKISSWSVIPYYGSMPFPELFASFHVNVYIKCQSTSILDVSRSDITTRKVGRSFSWVDVEINHILPKRIIGTSISVSVYTLIPFSWFSVAMVDLNWVGAT